MAPLDETQPLSPQATEDGDKGLLRSSTTQSALLLLGFSLADNTQPLWFPAVAHLVPGTLGYLGGGEALNVTLKLAGHTVPALIFFAGIIRGRIKAGGIKGLL